MIKLFILLFLISGTANAVSQDYIDQAFQTISREEGVPEDVLRAICWVESNHKTYAYNHGDSNQTDHAFGVCQVLYSTAHSMGLNDAKCLDDFREVSYRDRVYEKCKLFGPKTNIRYAARFLKSRLKKEDNLFKAIAAYNTGRYKICRDGWLYYQGIPFKRCLIGGPANMYYLIRVFEALKDRR